MSRTDAAPSVGRTAGLGARVRSSTPALMSATASVLVTVAALLIVRIDGLAAYGNFVTLQAVGVILGIPMVWGVHVNASRAMAAAGADAGAVVGTSLGMLAGATLLTSAGFLALLAPLSDVVPIAAPARLWPALGLGASTALLLLAEALLRIQDRQHLASGLRLGWAVAYLLAVVAVMAGGQGSAVRYALLVIASNVACAALMLAGLRGAPAGPALWLGGPRRAPGGGRTLRWDPRLAGTMLREGRTFSLGQSLLTLLFGFDAILLAQAAGPAAVAVYALYVSSLRRVIGVLFTDSLAALLIAALSSRKLSTDGRRAALRYAPTLLGLATLGSCVLILASLAAADALPQLVIGWVALAAVGCSAHALVIVLFAVFTVQPALGLTRVRTALTVAFLPGLGLQAVAAAVGGVAGMIIAFGVINVALAGWFLAVIQRSRNDTD